MVPREGVEPSLHCWKRILSPSRLPIPPSGPWATGKESRMLKWMMARTKRHPFAQIKPNAQGNEIPLAQARAVLASRYRRKNLPPITIRYEFWDSNPPTFSIL